MSSITLKRISRNFKKIRAINDISLQIRDNEFFVIFGPAGAGKTTILNIIAGILEPNQGVVLFDDEDVTLSEPADRNVAMVFENYALYPHMTAFDNIASPLRSPKYKAARVEIDKEVRRVASVLNITEQLDRLPSQMSNGQRQRVALGRALVRSPRVFLMDEPLAHLDAKLRHAMRKELKSIQANFNSTTIYVTHDYTEAMSLGDRIAVIADGEIQQVGTPTEVFYTPANRFVAKFFGDPEINIISVDLERTAESCYLVIPWEGKKVRLRPQVAEKLGNVQKLDIGLRGMDVQYSFDAVEGAISCRVYNVEPMGNRNCVTVEAGEYRLQFMVDAGVKPEFDSAMYFTFNIDHAIFFNRLNGSYIYRYGEDALRRGETVGTD